MPSELCVTPIKGRSTRDLVSSAYIEGIRQIFGLESSCGISHIYIIQGILWGYAAHPSEFIDKILEDLDGYYLYTIAQSGYLSDIWEIYLRTDSKEHRSVGRITISCIDINIRHKVLGETLTKLANSLEGFVN